MRNQEVDRERKRKRLQAGSGYSPYDSQLRGSLPFRCPEEVNPSLFQMKTPGDALLCSILCAFSYSALVCLCVRMYGIYVEVGVTFRSYSSDVIQLVLLRQLLSLVFTREAREPQESACLHLSRDRSACSYQHSLLLKCVS